MSIVKYNNRSYNIINDIQDKDSYFNYSLCQNIDSKEYVIVEKIDKEKLRNELGKLVIVDLNKTYEEYLNAYKKDIILLKECVCQNLLQGIDFIDEDEQIIVIKEYADMSLKDYIQKEKGHGITPKEIRFIFNQLNNALQIFNKKKNIHTCLSNENIFIQFKDHGLVTDNYTVKMADFGSIIKLEVVSKFQLNIRKKIPFMAPELFNSNEEHVKINDKCDLWSLGVLLYFLRFNELPFESELYKTYKILPDPQDPLLKDLINKLLIIEPSKRISWDEYFGHKFFLTPENEEEEIKLKRKRYREHTIRRDIIGVEKKGKNGKMTITYDNGDKYEGDFVDNVKEGKGI
jgi:serine/threonine protein kinase